MRGDYLGNADAYQLRIPNLRRLMHEGSYSPRTLSVFPTLTGTAHTALVTGTGAMKHGILCWDCSCPTPTASQSSECSSGRRARSPSRTDASVTRCRIGYSTQITRSIWRSRKQVHPDSCRKPAFVIGSRQAIASGFDGLARVAHHDGRAGEVEHLHVVQVVADRHHLVPRPAARLRPPRERRSLRAVRAVHVDEREVARLVLRDRHGVALGARQRPQRVDQHPHRGDAAVEHHLDWILGEHFGERRRRFGDERLVLLVVAAAVRVRPVHAFEDDLALVWPIEHDRHAVLVGARRLEELARHTAAQEIPHLGGAVRLLHERSVVDDERQRNRQQIRDRTREMKAAAGDERDLDAARNGGDDGVAVRLRKASAAVEQRAIDVDGEETDHGKRSTTAIARMPIGARRRTPPTVKRTHRWYGTTAARRMAISAPLVGVSSSMSPAPV